MPWEKSFDEEATVDKAMQVFWKKGFDSASIADLIESTGIGRGSLYNAYGGKQALFTRALLKYDRDNRQAMFARLEALDDPKQAIGTFFDDMVINAVSDSERKGCFLFNTMSESTIHDAEVNAIVANGLREIEAFFRRCIEVGQARGDIPKGMDPQGKARVLLAISAGIRALARGPFTEASLQAMADEARKIIE